MYGAGSTRGAAPDEVEDHAMVVVPLLVKAQKRPAAK
jgi:hypothetical protein